MRNCDAYAANEAAIARADRLLRRYFRCRGGGWGGWGVGGCVISHRRLSQSGDAHFEQESPTWEPINAVSCPPPSSRHLPCHSDRGFTQGIDSYLSFNFWIFAAFGSLYCAATSDLDPSIMSTARGSPSSDFGRCHSRPVLGISASRTHFARDEPSRFHWDVGRV